MGFFGTKFKPLSKPQRVFSTVAGLGLLAFSIRVHRAKRATLALFAFDLLKRGITGTRT